MTNIQYDVWKTLDRNPNIQRELKRGLINISALARFIIKEKKLNTTTDAVISAIRRYNPEKQDDVFANAYNLLGLTINISTKSNLAEIILTKDDDVQQRLPRLFEIIKYIHGDVLRVTQANKSINLIIDDKNISNVTTLFPKNKIMSKIKDLAEINITIHPKMQTTPGILAAFANELAMNGI